MPAVSPTLSPTLSAITAGLRGSSSGIPASILPTKSAPTSAPLVKIPPPNLAKTEIKDPPKPSPTNPSTLPVAPKYPATERSARPTTKRPVTEPPANETESASFKPEKAACAVRTFALTEIFIPINPDAAEATAPIKKPTAVSNEIKNQITAKIKTATGAIVRYCLER